MDSENLNVIGIKDVVDLTGLSRSTIYNFMKQSCDDPIPYWKKGGKILFDKVEVIKWYKNER